MIVDNKDRNYRSAGGSPALPAACPCRRAARTTGRSGATLIEVLVSIFIMGIGLMSLLVLFPLGALTMAAAIQSERAAQAAVAASAIANLKDIRRDPNIYNPALNIDFYRNPPGIGPANYAGLEERSYPVFIDPVGSYTAAGLPSQSSVYGMPPASLLLARTSVSFVDNTPPAFRSAMMYRWFTSQDDIIFEKDGSAKSVIPGPPPAIERDVRYSYAFLTQRPRTADPSVVDCSVVVYSGRPTGLSGNLDLAEFAYFQNIGGVPEVAFDPAINSIRIRYGAPFGTTLPPIRPGDWVLDVSVVPKAGVPPVGGAIDRHAYFYRVAGIAEGIDLSGTFVDLELQQRLRGFAGTSNAGPGVGNGARLLFLEGVAEVFERGLGNEPSTNP
jgi:type II secretory pathway pseudopilin PulG